MQKFGIQIRTAQDVGRPDFGNSIEYLNLLFGQIYFLSKSHLVLGIADIRQPECIHQISANSTNILIAVLHRSIGIYISEQVRRQSEARFNCCILHIPLIKVSTPCPHLHRFRIYCADSGSKPQQRMLNKPSHLSNLVNGR